MLFDEEEIERRKNHKIHSLSQEELKDIATKLLNNEPVKCDVCGSEFTKPEKRIINSSNKEENKRRKELKIERFSSQCEECFISMGIDVQGKEVVSVETIIIVG